MKKSVFAVLIVLIAILVAPAALAYGVTFYNPAWNPQDGIVFDVIKADTDYTFNVRIEDISVTKIIFSVERDAKNGGLTVYRLKNLPKHLPEVDENTTYEVNEIKYSGFVPHEMGDVTYEFKVAKSWLESGSVPRNSIVLHYYDRVTDVWEALDTEIVDETVDYVYFEAEYAGVHYIMMGKSLSEDISSSLSEEMSVEEGVVEEPVAAASGEESAPSKEPSEPLPVVDEAAAEVLSAATDVEDVDLADEASPEPLPESQPIEVRSGPPAPEQGPEPAEVIEKEDKGSRFAGVMVLGAVAALILVLYIIFGDKSVRSSVDKELHNYIRESLKRGKSKSDIRSRLLEVGWHTERVDKALSKHREMKHAVHHKHHVKKHHVKAKKK